MPCEIRDIVFSKDEVTAALCAHDRMCEQEIEGDVADLKVEDGNDLRVILHVQADGKKQAVTVDAGTLLDALVRYCIETNIMIPRRSKKSVLAAGDSARLRIELGVVAPELVEDAA